MCIGKVNHQRRQIQCETDPANHIQQVRSMTMTPHLDDHIHLETSSDDDEAPARTPRTANKWNTGGKLQ